MTLRCLLFSNDERAVRLLRLSLGDLDIEVEPCTRLELARELLLERKFDGVVADCELPDGPELLRSVRRSKHNRRSIIFALTGSEITMGQAFEMGAHFVIYKPLVSERVKRTLSAAHGLMMREKRLHFRHPAHAPASIRIGQRPFINISLIDLSQHGASLDIGTVLKKGQPVQLKFTLPDTSYVIDTAARVTWSGASGRAGVQFEGLPDETQDRLLRWAVERSLESPDPQAKRTEASLANGGASSALSHEESLDLGFEMVEQAPEEDPDIAEEDPSDSDSRLRATLRGQHRAAIKVLAFENGMPVIVQGRCQNLSELGLAATVEEDLGIGDAVLLQVEMPGGQKPIVLHATVRHCEDERYGFEFVAVDLAIRDMLHESVSNLPVE